MLAAGLVLAFFGLASFIYVLAFIVFYILFLLTVSTTAENQTLSNPMYIHSIPNNNDNQDIVSMGTNAANITKTEHAKTYTQDFMGKPVKFPMCAVSNIPPFFCFSKF